MGDMEDWEADASFWEYEQDLNLENDIWITKEGEEIKVKDLGNNHLANIIALLKRTTPISEVYKLWVIKLTKEQNRRKKQNGKKTK